MNALALWDVVEASEDEMAHIKNRALGSAPDELVRTAAKLKAVLDLNGHDFDHDCTVSSGGAVCVTARIGRQMSDYLLAVVPPSSLRED